MLPKFILKPLYTVAGKAVGFGIYSSCFEIPEAELASATT
jgi:hypothetical protein